MKLSDAQRVILAAACQRDDRNILPFPETLRAKGAALTRVINSLTKAGLIEEILADWREGTDNMWRITAGSTLQKLVATDAAFEAMGIEIPRAQPEPEPEPAPEAQPAAAKPRRTRGNTKQARLIEMLSHQNGASIKEIAEAMDWQPHTVRGAVAGALKKKLGLVIGTRKAEGRGTVYYLAG